MSTRKGASSKAGKKKGGAKGSAKKATARSTAAKGAAAKKATPSVMQFLEKLGGAPETSRKRSTPAKGLLGDISREDLVRAGRIDRDSAEGPPEPAADPPAAAPLEVELQSEGEGASARRSERLAWREQVKVSSVFAGAQQGTVGNLSSGGVFVETAHLLDEGDPVVLNFPGREGGPLHITGRVRWVTPFGGLDDARAGMGIEFVGLDERRRSRLESILAGLPQKAEPDH